MLRAVFALFGIAVFIHLTWKRAHPRLPPGPKPLPLVGNLRDLPSGKTPEYQHWLKFKDIYNPFTHLSVFGQSLIIIHDRDVAHELFEKVSTKTSGRPSFPMASKLCGYERFLSLHQYDNTFRQHRKLVHQQLGTRAATARFRDIQDEESRRFLLRVLDDPDNLFQHIKRETGAIILRMTYGYVVEPDKPDPLVQIVEQMMHEISLAATPLKWPVDIVPALKHLPESLPGMSWKRIAREWHKIASTVIEVPYGFVQQQMKKGDYKPSFVSSIIEQREASGTGDDEKSTDNDEDIRYTAATMYAAGADTTVLSLKSLILAMLLFPAVQKKAQEEIDNVIGTDTLPGLEDRERLPYVNALAKEAFRWLPVVPMGLSHVADEDIDFKEFHIPKGSFLLPAIWWFLHNPETFADPHAFDPERYLAPRDEPDPMGETFGYGRRICPGRFLADEVVFITIARLLATHDLRKAVDGRGAEIEPKIDVTTGLISHLLDFPYSIKPRNKHYADLVRSVEAEIPREDGDAGRLSFDGGWV